MEGPGIPSLCRSLDIGHICEVRNLNTLQLGSLWSLRGVRRLLSMELGWQLGGSAH